MDQIKTKIMHRLLLWQIDRLNSKKAFIEDYLPIKVDAFNQALEKKILAQKQKHDRILKPLELGTLSKADYLSYHLDPAIQKIDTKTYWQQRALRAKIKRLRHKLSKDVLEKREQDGLKSIATWRDQAVAKATLAIEKQYDVLHEQIASKPSYEDTKKRLDQDLQTYVDEQTALTNQKITLYQAKKQKELASIEQALIEKTSKLASIRSKDPDQNALKSIMQDDEILRLDQLSMHFGGLKAVDHLSFAVKQGEIFGLIGPNGAGKTTVFNCITQFYQATSGKIYYRNSKHEVVDLGHHKVHDVIKQGIVRTFQNVELIWELSVLGNMLVGAHSTYKSGFFSQLFHTPRLKREEAVATNKALGILKDLGIEMYKDVYPYGLPYGILKKIELARTLMTKPNMIILDEPAAGLNEAETKDLSETIKRIQTTYGCTIFLVEHDMQLVMDICDTICAISFGKKLAIGTPEQIKNDKIVQEAYLGGE